MVRSALGPAPRALAKKPQRFASAVPWISVLVASAMAALPIVARVGWWPEFGLLLLLAWRVHRADCWVPWSAALLGLFNDMMAGGQIGLSVAFWPFVMLAMDVVDRRTMWRDWRLEWVIATCFIALSEILEWQVAALAGAPVRFALVWPAIIVNVLCYPLAMFIVQRLDRWRDGR